MHKLEEVKARRQTIGAIKCIWTTKSGTLLSFLFGRKISFIEISARTIHFPKKSNNFTAQVWISPKLTRVNPSLVLTCARLHVQYGAGNCKNGAYCRFDHWIVKSQVHLHKNFPRKCCFPRYFQNIHTARVPSSPSFLLQDEVKGAHFDFDRCITGITLTAKQA